MPQMLTVRWPLFARLEALLFFPVALMLASQVPQVHTIIDRWVAPAVALAGARFGIASGPMFWVAASIVVIVPWLIALIVADRLLTVRKGYALLSIVAIGAWIWSAMHFADQLAELLPGRVVDAIGWPSFDVEAAIAAGVLAFLSHLRALWVGIRDEGDVAMRLIAAREEHAFRPASGVSRRAQDVYYRETASFRGWQPREQLEGPGGEPRETFAVKVLSVLTWMAVAAVTVFAYHNWDNLAAPVHANGHAAPPPEVVMGPMVPSHGVVSAGGVVSTGPVNASVVPIATPPPAPAVVVPRAMTASALPAVQRPSDMSANGRGSSVYVGPNEAVAERSDDGGFAFDSVVNGGHVRMLFDTGASVVVLRAEDAERIGINVNRLIYSAKVKTANGTADVAPIIIDTMLVGNIALRNVVGCVAKQGMLQQNLLGQAFLARLAGFNVEDNLLVLRGH
jgi:clan AA aspartic protease (TIGR02281 family)